MTSIGVVESLHGVVYKSFNGQSVDSALSPKGAQPLPLRWKIAGMLYVLISAAIMTYASVWLVGPEGDPRPSGDALSAFIGAFALVVSVPAYFLYKAWADSPSVERIGKWLSHRNSRKEKP